MDMRVDICVDTRVGGTAASIAAGLKLAVLLNGSGLRLTVGFRRKWSYMVMEITVDWQWR